MNKKGQAAMEFLMTYGWAILVVLVAIGALAYFGVLSPEKLLPEKCILATGSGLFCDKNLVKADASTSTITMRVKNTNVDAIQITSVAIGTACTDSTTVTNIAADGTADVVVDCAETLVAGKVKGDISVDYTVLSSDGNFTKKATGSLVISAA